MFEKESFEVTCPKCANKSKENITRLKTDGYTCPSCGCTCSPDELARAIKEVDDGFEKLRREFARVKKIAEGR
jgi:transposase-like protein